MMMRPERTGELIKLGFMTQTFTRPNDKRTNAYITRRFGLGPRAPQRVARDRSAGCSKPEELRDSKGEA